MNEDYKHYIVEIELPNGELKIETEYAASNYHAIELVRSKNIDKQEDRSKSSVKLAEDDDHEELEALLSIFDNHINKSPVKKERKGVEPEEFIELIKITLEAFEELMDLSQDQLRVLGKIGETEDSMEGHMKAKFYAIQCIQRGRKAMAGKIEKKMNRIDQITGKVPPE